MGKLPFTPLKYPLIGELTPNVPILVDDPPELANLSQLIPSVHLVINFDGKTITCNASDILSKNHSKIAL